MKIELNFNINKNTEEFARKFIKKKSEGYESKEQKKKDNCDLEKQRPTTTKDPSLLSARHNYSNGKKESPNNPIFNGNNFINNVNSFLKKIGKQDDISPIKVIF